MTHDEITHLGTLSRIALTQTEIANFTDEIDAILTYVSTVNTIVANGTLTANVGARYNVLRPDIVTEEPGSHTEVLLDALPVRDGQYMSVKKILQQSQ